MTPAPIHTTPGCRNRLSRAQRELLRLLREHESLSYDAMAERLGVDRATAIQAVHRLQRQQIIEKIKGSGTRPNRYRVLTTNQSNNIAIVPM